MKVDRVEWHVMPDPSTAAAALQAGEVDLWEQAAADLLPVLEKDKNVAIRVPDHLGSTYVLRFNWKQPPFDNVKVREALNWAINRQSLVDNILKGTAEPALGYTPKADASFRPESEVYGYDPAKAKQMLAEAGYPDGFTMTLSYPTSGSGNMVPTPMNTALQADLAAIGAPIP